MEPVEIKGRLKAFAKSQKATLEGFDTLAWLIGYYVAQGLNNAKKYPKKPSMVKRDLVICEMEEDNMKDILTVFAEIHNKGVENANHA